MSDETPPSPEPKPKPGPANTTQPAARRRGHRLTHHTPDPSVASLSPWRRKLHDILFEAETPAGKAFDVALLVAILASVAVVMLDTVESVHAEHGRLLLALEIGFTALFTVEYILRICASAKPTKYIFSFYGLVDLLAILPTYFLFAFPAAKDTAIFRALRLIRVFRVLKLAQFVAEAALLKEVVVRSREKMVVFLMMLAIVVVLAGTLIYEVEGGREGADINSIPEGMYWSIVTLTTVGYGDFTPHTVAGKVLASFMMVLGYAMIVVPVGVYAVEFSRAKDLDLTTEACPHCHKEGHVRKAVYCHRCGEMLND